MNALTKSWRFARTILFYIGYIVLTGWFTVTGLLFFSFFPLSIRGRYLIVWNRWILVWLRFSCGVRYRVVGNIPDGHYVVMSKHQSQWETFYLQHAFFPVGVVLKRELLNMPFFGWALRLMEPIAIDRSNPKAALRYILNEGVLRLQQGKRVLIFPEGTRTAPGQKGNYARSGANIAINGGASIVPVAHNAGECWQAHKFIKKPGLITVVIGAPIPADNTDSRRLTAQVEQWIEAEQAKLSPSGNKLEQPTLVQ
ncbi:MAG: 1-acyl-sn-glycerol-3-phosphate acyltransferase [Bacteroidia bacterium]|jgi:1-acyl-sn-glycerol-3-phosphate acyltransferase